MGQTWLSQVQQFKGNYSLVDLLLSSENCELQKNALFALVRLFRLLSLDCNSKVISSDCKAETLHAQNNMILTYSCICWSLSVLNLNFRNCLAVSFLASFIWPSNEKNTSWIISLYLLQSKAFADFKGFITFFLYIVFLHMHFKFKYLCY